MRMSFSPKSESKSVSVPVAVYAIIIIGTTVSLAGKPSIKAVSMTPSSPMSFANGSSAPEKADNRLSPRTVTFAASQIIMPAGAATAAALPRTKRVLSKIERTMTFKTCGFLYGGISRVNDDGTPRRSVFDSIRDETKVKKYAEYNNKRQKCGGKYRTAYAEAAGGKKYGYNTYERRKTPVAGDKAVCYNGYKLFARTVYYAAAGDPYCVAPEAHTHRESLFAAGTAFSEAVVKIKRNSRQVSEVLKQGEQGEKILPWEAALPI